MSRFSVLDYRPNIALEEHSEVEEEVSTPLELIDTESTLDDTQSVLSDNFESTNNVVTEIIAAEKYYEVLVKYNQTNIVVSNEVYELVKQNLGLESNDGNLGSNLINFVKGLIKQLIEAIKRGFKILANVVRGYFNGLRTLEKDLIKTKSLLTTSKSTIEGTTTVKESDFTSYMLTEGANTENYLLALKDFLSWLLSENMFNGYEFINETGYLGKAKEPTILPGNKLILKADTRLDADKGHKLTNMVLSFEDSPGKTDDSIELKASEVIEGRNKKRALDKVNWYLDYIKDLAPLTTGFNALVNKKLKEIDSIESRLTTLGDDVSNAHYDEWNDIQGLIELRAKINFIPEFFKYLITLMENDRKVIEHFLH